MFAILEKNGERKAVHSQRDLEYLMTRGWRVPAEPKAAEVRVAPKKRGRPAKDRK